MANSPSRTIAARRWSSSGKNVLKKATFCAHKAEGVATNRSEKSAHARLAAERSPAARSDEDQAFVVERAVGLEPDKFL